MFLTGKKQISENLLNQLHILMSELELHSDSSDLFASSVNMLFAIRCHFIPGASAHSCNRFYDTIPCVKSLTCLLWKKDLGTFLFQKRASVLFLDHPCGLDNRFRTLHKY
jgi:hypothetical protein